MYRKLQAVLPRVTSKCMCKGIEDEILHTPSSYAVRQPQIVWLVVLETCRVCIIFSAVRIWFTSAVDEIWSWNGQASWRRLRLAEGTCWRHGRTCFRRRKAAWTVRCATILNLVKAMLENEVLKPFVPMHYEGTPCCKEWLTRGRSYELTGRLLRRGAQGLVAFAAQSRIWRSLGCVRS